MTHGPCAGVRADGDCEVPEFGPCTFVGVPLDEWPYAAELIPAGPTTPSRLGLSERALEFLALARTRPVVIVDLPAAPLSAPALLASAAELAGAADALLLGDHGGARVQFPPSYRAKLLADVGLPVWVGLNCRDRNRVALEGEVAACLDAGVLGLHCVTGDHTELGERPDAQPVFDFDGLDTVELAARYGALISVAHAPSAPPVEHRLPRLLAKVAAGAWVVFVDHCGGPAEVAGAVAALRAAGFVGLVLGCVPIATDHESAAVLESFARDRLPPRYVSDILAAADLETAGIEAAVELSRRLLAIPGVDGVNLSCGGGPGQELATARSVATISRQVLDLAHPSILQEAAPCQ